MDRVPAIPFVEFLSSKRQPTWIIAEIGIDHGGSEDAALQLIAAAADAGADAVKLQTVTPEESYHPETESRRLFGAAQLPEGALVRLKAFATSKGVTLFTTPGDPTALKLVASVDFPVIKISSGLLTNLPLIRSAAALGKPMILSTGMATLQEVEAGVRTAREGGAPEVVILQCTSLYPSPPESLNLAAMATLRAELGVEVGFSCHYQGDLACLAAVAAGARVIEKHFRVDTVEDGPDAAVALEAGPFAEMVRKIRMIETMRGSSVKQPTDEEAPLRDGRHRRLVAARDLPSGHCVTVEDLYLMRLPGDMPALPAADLDRVLGRCLVSPVRRLTGLEEAMMEREGTKT